MTLEQSFENGMFLQPAQVGLLYMSLACYAAAALAVLMRPPWAVWPLRLGVALHLLAMTARGWAIGFFPLTNKMESFSAAALAVAVVALLSWRNVRLYSLPLLTLICVALATALSFSTALTYPPPLMQTIWYPIHVPLSFVAYGTWSAAAAASLVWLRDRDMAWLATVDRLAFLGFGLWSVSMISGGIWGVVAWGAYFLWDVKILWSVILWFHYATFVHLRLAPPPWSNPSVRPALAVLGFVWVFIAYVGTSFFFGKSSHAF
jgi:ABC-type transport system involved in cytochrome c biogenesis permease subunit